MGIIERPTCRRKLPQSVTFEKMSGFPTHEEGIESVPSGLLCRSLETTCLWPEAAIFPPSPRPTAAARDITRASMPPASPTRQCSSGRRWDTRLPCAYGVSIPLKDGLLCLGGNNDAGSLNAGVRHPPEAWARPAGSHWPALPVAMDNFTGSSDGNAVVVYDSEHLFRSTCAIPARAGKRCP